MRSNYLKALSPCVTAALRRRLSGPLCTVVLLSLSACSGTAVVTLTSTASQDTFLTYRVGLVSVKLQKSTSGGSTLQTLSTGTTVDLAKLVNLSEVLGAAAVAKGSYSSAVITLDYSAADIVFDDAA